MQPEERDAAYLWDILQAAKDIQDFTASLSYAQFAADRKSRFAVERQLLVIGEAANRLSPALKAAHPQIPWKKMIGQRNVLAHEYGEILVERIWITAKESIPLLVQQLSGLLPPTD